MSVDEKWAHLLALDDEFLKGGVILSEWCVFIVREADISFVNGAYLASILTSVSGIETYLRSEYSSSDKETLAQLIDHSPIQNELRRDLHTLRKYRNNWVHIQSPWEDRYLHESPDRTEQELEKMAYFATHLLRKTIYVNPWI